ncbi:MAG: sulfite exporter TauE/SafE family protein [Negativicutes bacterium]|nr:sulfite exporter TauE/SafE family protein [Negativicutes bacterium]
MIIAAILTGIVTGVLSGLLGIGGGAIFVASGVLFLGVSQHAAQAAALAAMIPTAVVGVIKHHRNRLINYRLAVFLAAGAVAGGFVGSYAANITPELVLRKIFAVFFAVMSVQMFWSSLKSDKKQTTGPSPAGGEK